MTANDFNYRCWSWSLLTSVRKRFSAASLFALMQMKTEMWCHPSAVSVGLLSCNNLISQHHTSTGLWQHLMRVVLFSSVSNFMTSPLFYSTARGGLWTCNDNWEGEKKCAVPSQELKLCVCTYACFSVYVCVCVHERVCMMISFSAILCSMKSAISSWLFFIAFTSAYQHYIIN